MKAGDQQSDETVGIAPYDCSRGATVEEARQGSVVIFDATGRALNEILPQDTDVIRGTAFKVGFLNGRAVITIPRELSIMHDAELCAFAHEIGHVYASQQPGSRNRVQRTTMIKPDYYSENGADMLQHSTGAMVLTRGIKSGIAYFRSFYNHVLGCEQEAIDCGGNSACLFGVKDEVYKAIASYALDVHRFALLQILVNTYEALTPHLFSEKLEELKNLIITEFGYTFEDIKSGYILAQSRMQ